MELAFGGGEHKLMKLGVHIEDLRGLSVGNDVAGGKTLSQGLPLSGFLGELCVLSGDIGSPFSFNHGLCLWAKQSRGWLIFCHNVRCTQACATT